MVKRYYEDFLVIVLLVSVTKGTCDENNEATRAGVEYIQIFRDIPHLFEYFLDVLEKRVEILERNDIDAYLDKSSNANNLAEKREIPDSCLHNVGEVDEENNNCDKHKYKRQSDDGDTDNEYTTEVHEYGISIKKNTNKANEETDDNKITKFLDKRYVNVKNQKNKNGRVKRNVFDFGEGFLGIDWSLFFLSPEEVADKVMETEQLLEEHNNQS